MVWNLFTYARGLGTAVPVEEAILDGYFGGAACTERFMHKMEVEFVELDNLTEERDGSQAHSLPSR